MQVLCQLGRVFRRALAREVGRCADDQMALFRGDRHGDHVLLDDFSEPNACVDRWAAGGSDFFNEMLAADIVWTIEGSGPGAGTYRGRDDFIARAVRPLASRMSAPVRPVSKRVWADGDHVIINWAGEGVARDGRPYRNHYAWIFRMSGGKAVEVNAFLDLTAYDDVLRRIPKPDVASPMSYRPWTIDPHARLPGHEPRESRNDGTAVSGNTAREKWSDAPRTP